MPQEPWLSLDPLRRANVHFEEVHRLVRGIDRSAAGAATMEDLAGLGLAGAGSRYRFQISGGMAQRVAIAATRATEAPVLLADKPTKSWTWCCATRWPGCCSIMPRRAACC